MNYESIAPLASIIGLVIFMSLFAGVLVYAFWPSNRSKFHKAAAMPLDDSDLEDR